MDISNIMTFIGLHLEQQEKTRKQISELSIEKFIQEQDEVGRAVDLDQINEALGKLLYAGWLKISGTTREDGNLYSRNIGEIKMPEYQYQCKTCKTVFTISGPLGITINFHPVCPNCQGKNVVRKWTNPNVIYKGQGFYTTDKNTNRG